jgi:CheY-like chemotaxis protein
LQDNTTDTAVITHSGKNTLPLYNFFIALKRNNFLVTPGQIADSNIIIDTYSPLVKNEAELCRYLSPVFANSQEEQLQFEQIFDAHFKMATADDNGEKKKPEKTFWQKHWWKFALALIGIAAILWYVSNNILAAAIPSKPQINLLTDVEPVKYISEQQKTTQRTASAWLSIMDILNPDYLKYVTKKATYNWGDGTAPDTASKHVYNKEGNFNIIAYVGIYYRNNFQYTDTLKSTIAICFAADTQQLKTSITGDIKIGDIITITAINAGKKDTVEWSGAEHVADKKENGNAITLRYDKPGAQTIGCSAYNPGSAVICEKTGTISFRVNDTAAKPGIILSVPATAKALTPQYKVKTKLFAVLGVLALLLMAATTYLSKKINRQKKQQQSVATEINEQYLNLQQSFLGRRGDIQLPFANKNYLPLPEQEIEDLARQMRKRISDDTLYLHVQKTIHKAINHAGFFQPVTAVRTQQSEYLVLIDDNATNSQQVKLFEYLLELLAKQNVFIEKYYYRAEPRLCYKEQGGATISLEKLSEKYPKHVLLFFGNAYQLVYQLYPVIDSSYQPLLNRWQYKAILTPVSFLDWGNKEKKVLPDELPVLPVDIPGQILLLQKLFNEGINVLADLKLYHNEFYEALPVDFEDIDELHDYCDAAVWAVQSGSYKNILFQWIAALAVYPKIRWELTLAIGKNILEAYGKTPELNFTTLLRIARIKWMKDGRFPDYTRLNLLKQLSRENEIIARETILEALKEIPEIELSATHFAFEEKEVQRLTNEFTLYAYNPEKYAAYKNSRDLFEQLRADKQITDIPAKNYLENPDSKWDTLINKPISNVAAAGNTANVPLDGYFGWDKKGRFFLKNIYLWATALSSVCFVAALIGLIGLIILNFSNSQRFRVFTSKQAFTDSVKFNYIDTSGSKLADDLILNVDSIQVSLNNYQPAVLLLNINDSLKNIAVKVNGDMLFDTTMAVKYDGYNITLEKNKIPPGIVWPNFTTGVWILRNAVDSSGINWNNSILKFTSQKDTTGRLILSGVFTWRSNSVLMGTEQFMGSYATDSRMINLKGRSVSSLTKAGKELNLGLGSYTAVLTANEQNLSEGTWGSASSSNKIVPLKNNNKWSASRDSSIKKAGTTAEQVSPVLNPLINIRISDNSLSSSAAAFAAELKVKGYNVQKIEKWDYNENSRIYYYSAAFADRASAIKKIYDKYYPELNVLTRLVQRNESISSNNFVTIWIKKYDPVVPVVPKIEIKNIELPASVTTGQLLNLGFDIINKNAVTVDVRQNAVSKKIAGQICVYSEIDCEDFTFTDDNIVNIKRQIDISKKEPGRHEVKVIIKELNINQSLGFFTIEKNIAATGNKRILWVDDTPKNNQAVIDALEKDSYKVQTVTSNDMALKYLQKRYSYDIVITDLGRDNKNTGESSITFLKQLKGLIDSDNVIIYTSPVSEKKYGKAAAAMGYYQIITNAGDLQQLLQKLTNKKNAN